MRKRRLAMLGVSVLLVGVVVYVFQLPPLGLALVIAGIAILTFVAIFTWLLRFYTIQEGTIRIVTRFGKYLRTEEPGLRFLYPLEDLGAELSRAEQTGSYAGQSVVCLDGVTIGLDMAIKYIIEDAYRAAFAVTDWKQVLTRLACATLQEVVSQRDVLQMQTERTRICQELQGRLNTQARPIGLRITWVGFEKVTIPTPILNANAENWVTKMVNQLYLEISTTICNALNQPAYGRELFLALKSLRILENMSKGDTTKILIPSELSSVFSRMFTDQGNVVRLNAGAPGNPPMQGQPPPPAGDGGGVMGVGQAPVGDGAATDGRA